MQTLKAGVLYFGIVFGVGFVLGPIRIRWIAPRFGTRIAELMEAPIMLAVTVIAAVWVVRYLECQSGNILLPEILSLERSITRYSAFLP